MLFRISERQPKFFSVPVALMDFIIGAMELIGKVIPPVGVRLFCTALRKHHAAHAACQGHAVGKCINLPSNLPSNQGITQRGQQANVSALPHCRIRQSSAASASTTPRRVCWCGTMGGRRTTLMPRHPMEKTPWRLSSTRPSARGWPARSSEMPLSSDDLNCAFQNCFARRWRSKRRKARPGGLLSFMNFGAECVGVES